MEHRMADRLEELEIRVAFQDRTIQELNDVVTRQQSEITRLAREIESLKGRLGVLMPELVVPRSEETPPPHY
jgi:SlyX protein